MLWGKCRPECQGEMPGPDSEYNIARDTERFATAWGHGLYNLRRFETGFCFTYDPPEKSGRGVSNGLYIMLGHEDLGVYKNKLKIGIINMLYSFDIYLHEKVFYSRCLHFL